MRHLTNAQYWDRPAGGNTGRLFLVFGGPVCADRISNCPLDRVLTYKNLIYILNLQYCKLPYIYPRAKNFSKGGGGGGGANIIDKKQLKCLVAIHDKNF